MGEILVAYDGSDAARRALESGLAHAEAGQGDLVVLVVAPLPVVEDDGSGRFTDPTPLVDEGATALEAARAQVDEAGVDARLVEALGDPVETIVRYANEHPVEVIVMGSGAQPSPPPSLGKVTTAVAKDVRCDVVLVP
jgi:nucleotide-binding universal stress UspA family protein